MKYLFKIGVLVIWLQSAVFADLLLSEILANEPGSRVLLEWIEIYNNGPAQIDLGNYLLVENDDTLSISGGSMVNPLSYAVICRRLEPSDGSDCFEYFWGDSSGTWGDSPDESYPAFELGFSLSNSEGSIYLLTTDGQGLDHYIWSQAADDGRSVERKDITDPLSGWHDCYDSDGSTPGRANSLIPDDDKNYFLEVIPQIVSLSGGAPVVTISYATPTGTKISLFVYDDAALLRNILEDNAPMPLGQIIWNLTDDRGRRLTPGLYFISFQTSGELNIQKSIPIVISP